MDADQTRAARAAENENAEGENETEAESAGAGEGDNPPSTERRTAERNEKILRGVEGSEKPVGEIDSKPPRIGEGISRLAGGAASGAGSAAEGIGEGVGKAASGVGSAVKAVGHAAEKLVGEDATPLRSATTHKNPYTLDASASWGRSGQVETTRERNSETIPPEAQQSMGIAPGDVSQTNPMPQPLPGPAGSRFEPDTDHSAGTWNMADIAR
jgi:hypothetical protein